MGGKACADDAKVRAKATTINFIIASLPVVSSMFLAPQGCEAQGEPMAERILHRFNGAVTNRPALAKRKKNLDVQQSDTPALTR
jgi:hypothetical protein